MAHLEPPIGTGVDELSALVPVQFNSVGPAQLQNSLGDLLLNPVSPPAGSQAHFLINAWTEHQAHTCTLSVTERLHLPMQASPSVDNAGHYLVLLPGSFTDLSEGPTHRLTQIRALSLSIS